MTNVSGRKKAGVTEASYDSDGTTLNASVKALHVLLCKEDGTWSAQGVEIDYAASGADVDQTIHNFVEGLVLTVAQHLLIHGNLDKVLSFAPKEILSEWLKTPPNEIKAVGFKATMKAFQDANVSPEKAKAFPFDSIQFVKPERHEAVAA